MFFMELFGIFFSIPVSLVASLVYCFFLQKVVLKSDRASRAVRIASYVVLLLFVIEIVLLISLGAVHSRSLVGPAFTVFHFLIFFLGTPALAGSLVLRPRGGLLLAWYASAFLCTLFALCLVLLQYSVSEALYGIDDESGPYSMSTSSPAHQRHGLGSSSLKFTRLDA